MEQESVEKLIVPDSVVPIVGWRFWLLSEYPIRRLFNEGNRVELESVLKTTAWPHREKLTAVCKGETWYRTSSHQAPYRNCKCGIYGVKSTSRLRSAANGLTRLYDLVLHGKAVVGRFKGWGLCETAAYGFRCQFAYPEIIYLPDQLMVFQEPLAISYGVPVESVPNDVTAELGLFLK